MQIKITTQRNFLTHPQLRSTTLTLQYPVVGGTNTSDDSEVEQNSRNVPIFLHFYNP